MLKVFKAARRVISYVGIALLTSWITYAVINTLIRQIIYIYKEQGPTCLLVLIVLVIVVTISTVEDMIMDLQCLDKRD